MAKRKRSQRTKPSRSPLRLIPRHGAFPLALAAGAIAFVVALFAAPTYAMTIGANAMFATHLLVVFIEMPRLTPEFLKEHSREQDVPAPIIFFVTIAVVAIGVVALFLALDSPTTPDPLEIALGVVAVILGWFVVHTMAALHYAYEYYDAPEANPGVTGKNAGSDIVGGLEWPEESDDPDGGAFLYLAYQIGTAVQISDVRATSNEMRRIVTTHAVFAFFYNTLLVAAAVNVVLNAAGGN
jgi:uncharacterized membrane protein